MRTVDFIVLVFGVMIGAYLPLALFYLVSFFRREHLGFILIWRAAARLAVIVMLFLLIFAALGLAEKFLGLDLKTIDDKTSLYLGFGVIGSFLVGIILFVIGLARGRRRTAAGAAA